MSSLPYEVRTCRLCGEHVHRSRLLKYGTRDYAHFECYVERKTPVDRDRLPDYERRALDRWLAEKRTRHAADLV